MVFFGAGLELLLPRKYPCITFSCESCVAAERINPTLCQLVVIVGFVALFNAHSESPTPLHMTKKMRQGGVASCIVVGNYCHDVLIKDSDVLAESLGGAASFISGVLDGLSVTATVISKVGSDFSYAVNHPPLISASSRQPSSTLTSLLKSNDKTACSNGFDPTGARDSFLGGLVAGLAQGLAVPDAALLGNFLGSLTVGQMGLLKFDSDLLQMVKEEVHRKRLRLLNCHEPEKMQFNIHETFRSRRFPDSSFSSKIIAHTSYPKIQGGVAKFA